jgi:hypothetical protein
MANVVAILAAVVLVGCGSGPMSVPPGGASSPPESLSQATASPAGEPSVEPSPVDLAAVSPVWFAPLPPMPTDAGRPFIGSEDFMDLFTAEAPWQTAADRIGVFKLYGEWVAYHATDAQLRTAVQEIARRGLVLAVEMGPLDPPADCGTGVESFAGTDEGRLISRRIRNAGGTLQVIALDEPYYFAHLYDGQDACRWTLEEVAQGVAHFRDVMREEWPAVVIGDTEPMPAPVTPAGLSTWLDAYRHVAGEPFAFLHLDMDWSIEEWPQLGLDVEAAGDGRGVPVGMIYNGGSAASDAQWLAVAGRRIDAYEARAGATPDQVLFQSWMDKPDRALPETDASTFTWLINAYIDDPASLAHLAGGAENIAFDRPVTGSSATADSPPDRVVDGDPDSIWNSGGPPPGWVEIDLGESRAVTEIRLLAAQSPAGPTTHLVGCRSTLDGGLTQLATLEASTTDGELLPVTLSTPATCRILRVETTASPSWVAWREIEVTVAE